MQAARTAASKTTAVRIQTPPLLSSPLAMLLLVVMALLLQQLRLINAASEKN